MLEAMANCGRWSDILVVRFPEIESGLRILEKTLSISILEWLLSLVGYVCVGVTYENKKSEEIH